MVRVRLNPEPEAQPPPAKQQEKQARRDAEGRFVKGSRGGGRKPGALNAISRDLGENILTAADRVGEDGKGRNGRIGYLTHMARTEPQLFVQLLSKMVVQRVEAGITNKVEPTVQTVAEVQAEMRRLGIPVVPSLFEDSPWVEGEAIEPAEVSRPGDLNPGPPPPFNKLN